MLDQLQTFIDKYHILGLGVGLSAISFALVFFFKDVADRWITHKNRNKKII